MQATRFTMQNKRSSAFTTCVPWRFKANWSPRSHANASMCDREDRVVVTYRGRKIDAKPGERLRTALIRSGSHPHNGGLLVTCKGIGTCGTCAVAVVDGEVEPAELSWREKTRLSLPPHSLDAASERGLRLACQVRVVTDVTVAKHAGFWGHKGALLKNLDD